MPIVKDGTCNSELQINCKLRYCNHLRILSLKIRNVRNTLIIRNSAINPQFWLVNNLIYNFTKTLKTNISVTKSQNFIKILPFDSYWWGESNEYNFIKIRSLVTEIFVFKVWIDFILTKNHVIYYWSHVIFR